MREDNRQALDRILFGVKLLNTLKKKGRKAGKEEVLGFLPGATIEEANHLIDRIFILTKLT